MNYIHPLSHNKGVALVIGVVIMSLILTTALAVSSIFIGEIKNSRIFENSTQAFYAADSGAEAILNNQRKNPEPIFFPQIECNNALLGPVVFDNSALDCSIEVDTGAGGDTILRVTGKYKGTEAQRRVEVTY